MTAITKTYTNILNASLDPDAPLLSTLMYALRDNAQFVYEWLGASYTAGAVQDHNHDGLNSSKLPVGPNMLRNGDFENALVGWTPTQYVGGTIAASATNFDGSASAAITSTVLANGGGDILSNEFMVCDGGAAYTWLYSTSANVANVSSKIEIVFYDSIKALISTTAVQTNANTPTASTIYMGVFSAPANARYMKMRCTGGIPSAGTAVGTVYFDSIFFTRIFPNFLAAGNTSLLQKSFFSWTNPGAANTWNEVQCLRINASGNYTFNHYCGDGSVNGNGNNLRVYRNGVAYGAQLGNAVLAVSYVGQETLNLLAGDSVQIFAYESSGWATQSGYSDLLFDKTNPLAYVSPTVLPIGQR